MCGQVVIALISVIPGYWVTVFTVERMGRIPIQVLSVRLSPPSS